ncbi:hypothetical protein EON64_13620 [archaeon]|nr:MAG: hypothetical protein EON64_13620 [archaeon]
MRKNQFEEALFKCEDERFEIDMLIDSNMSTIRYVYGIWYMVYSAWCVVYGVWINHLAFFSLSRILEPLAEEIVAIKNLHTQNNNANPSSNPAVSPALPGAPRFSLQLDKRQLSNIHLNAICRIYGEQGGEVIGTCMGMDMYKRLTHITSITYIELLKRNPAGTIPVILKRLKQKNEEWKKAKHEMSKNWYVTPTNLPTSYSIHYIPYTMHHTPSCTPLQEGDSAENVPEVLRSPIILLQAVRQEILEHQDACAGMVFSVWYCV